MEIVLISKQGLGFDGRAQFSAKKLYIWMEKFFTMEKFFVLVDFKTIENRKKLDLLWYKIDIELCTFCIIASDFYEVKTRITSYGWFRILGATHYNIGELIMSQWQIWYNLGELFVAKLKLMIVLHLHQRRSLSFIKILKSMDFLGFSRVVTLISLLAALKGNLIAK